MAAARRHTLKGIPRRLRGDRGGRRRCDARRGPADPYANPSASNAPAAGQQPVDATGRYDAASGDRYASPPGHPPAAPASPFLPPWTPHGANLEAGQLAPALRQLSSWYDDPRLSPAEKQQLNQLLDQVAGTVVYSTQHLLEAPYEVQPGERLEDIAQRYNVPWQLLAKINGIDDPQTLRAGERLKVMRGPFAAVISLDKRQLTLLLGDGSYAGRFNIGIGREHPPAEGRVRRLRQGRSTRSIAAPIVRSAAATRTIRSATAGSAWAASWASTARTARTAIGRTDLPGSISLSPRDVEDVYDILSVGSKVIIRR